MNLFESPIKNVKVNNAVTAMLYNNGTIIIGTQKYIGYSLTSAIKHWKKNYGRKKRSPKKCTQFTTPTSCGTALSLPKPMYLKEAQVWIRNWMNVNRLPKHTEIW